MTTKAWDRGTGPAAGSTTSVLSYAWWRGLLRRPRVTFDALPPDVPTPPAAVLWDMDGLLVDSEPIWTVAERELFARWDLEFTPVMKAAIVGNRMDVAVPTMISLAGPAARDADVGEVSAWLLARMTELFAEKIPLRPGARALLDDLRTAGVPQALVSSSYRVLVDAVLAGIPGHPFAASVAGDEVAHGKPDPEPYLTAARNLDVDPTTCVVLEDTPTGCRAGIAAGCRVVYSPSVAGTGAAEPGWRAAGSLEAVSYRWLSAWPVDPSETSRAGG